MSNIPKYYTPEIEEFYVGFEYEYNTDEHLYGLLDRTNGVWNKEVYQSATGQDGESEHNDIEKLIQREEVRVKHLDREDIESLGFVYQISSWNRDDNSRSCINLESPMMDGSMQFEKVIGEQSVFQITFNRDIIKIIHATLSENSFGFMMAEPNKTSKEIQKPKKLMVFNLLFKGKIKNKSELKKVLKMIGVIE